MWTLKEFPKDFILKLEFRAAVNADSGIFLRKPQLQCRDYLVAGPYKELKKYKPQEWNTIEVVVKDNVAHCTCNGELLEDALKLPGDRPDRPGRRPRADGLPAHSDQGIAVGSALLRPADSAQRQLARVGNLRARDGSNLSGRHRHHRSGLASKGDELDFVGLVARINVNDCSDIAGLEALLGKRCRQDDSIMFVDHGASRTTRDAP